MKVCIFLAEGFEEVEALTVVDICRRTKEVECIMVSITGDLMVKGAHNICVKADILFEHMQYDDVEMLILPGGMPGTLNLGKYEPLVSLLKEFHSKGKKIAAICAAPSILGKNGILEGKKATCYPDFEEQLIGAIITNEDTTVDGNIITGRGMGTAIDFALKIVGKLQGTDSSDKIAHAIKYSNS